MTWSFFSSLSDTKLVLKFQQNVTLNKGIIMFSLNNNHMKKM